MKPLVNKDSLIKVHIFTILKLVIYIHMISQTEFQDFFRNIIFCVCEKHASFTKVYNSHMFKKCIEFYTLKYSNPT